MRPGSSKMIPKRARSVDPKEWHRVPRGALFKSVARRYAMGDRTLGARCIASCA